MRKIRVAPSLLSCDLGHVGDEVRSVEAAGADLLHFDVMDGHFVPNLTFGPGLCAAVRHITKLPLDVHLMVTNPDELLEPFVQAGASRVAVHVEVVKHLHRTLTHIRSLGAQPGVALNPATPVQTLDLVLPELEFVLVMSVNPGKLLHPSLLIYDPDVPKEEALWLDMRESPELAVARTLRPAELDMAMRAYLDPRTRISYFTENSLASKGS